MATRSTCATGPHNTCTHVYAYIHAVVDRSITIEIFFVSLTERPSNTPRPIQSVNRASLVDRFPLEDNQESRIENGISDFCFPDGLKLSRGMVMPKFFCFVLTDGEGNRTYGSCLTIFELLPEDAEAALREQIAAWEQRQAERRRQKAEEAPPLVREEGTVGVFFSEGSLGDDGASSSGGDGSDSEERDGEAEGEEGAEARAAAAEGIYLPRCLCVLSKHPFVGTTRAWLMQLYRLSLTPTPGEFRFWELTTCVSLPLNCRP